VYGRSAALLLALAAAAAPAAAVLGEEIASVQADQLRLGAQRRASAQPAAGWQVHELVLADGSRIRQYATPGGRVFAVTWQMRGKPRLDQLLGTHFAAYAEAGRRMQAARPGIVRAARIAEGDLVVESTAHLQAHVGRAWLRSQLPAGTSTDALR